MADLLDSSHKLLEALWALDEEAVAAGIELKWDKNTIGALRQIKEKNMEK